MEIEINKTYNYFDDGKIKESRKMTVTITDIIPFDKIDEETLLIWKEEVEECDWLYAKETDFFIKGALKLSHGKEEFIFFVRTINNNDGWFSIGQWGGRLDIDGSLASSLYKCKNKIVKRTYSILDDKECNKIQYAIAPISATGQEIFSTDINEAFLFDENNCFFPEGNFSGNDRYGDFAYKQEMIEK